MKHAAYAASPGSHFALAEASYMHFTSPIRRYPDLYSHQMLDELLAGRRPKREATEPDLVARSSTEAEIRAETAEREVTKMVALTYLEDFVGQRFEGVVTGANWSGLWVELTEVGVDGRVSLSDMPGGHYAYDERKMGLAETATGTLYRIGASVAVRVLESRPYARMLDLELLGPSRKSRASPAR